MVGVAGVTGRTDELSEQEYVKVWRTWFLSRGVWAWGGSGDGTHHQASPQGIEASPNFKFQLLVVQHVPGDLVLEQLLSTVQKTTTEW